MTGHILFDLLCIAYLIYKVFKIYSCYNSCQIFLPFYIYISHFVYPFTCYVHLGYQHVLAIVTNAAMKLSLQISYRVPAFILNMYSEMEPWQLHQFSFYILISNIRVPFPHVLTKYLDLVILYCYFPWLWL